MHGGRPARLDLAVDLVDLVDPGSDGDLLDRVQALRRTLATEFGVVMPSVRTRDSVELPWGRTRSRSMEWPWPPVRRPPDDLLVIADDVSPLPGTPVDEPVFGLTGQMGAGSVPSRRPKGSVRPAWTARRS